jgi:NAD(P)H-hydrate epimerase
MAVMVRLSRAQVREVDRRAIEQYHIPGIILMENAAVAVADAACEMLDKFRAGPVLILVGGGNNGGDGLAAARHLHNRGVKLSLMLTTDPGRFAGDALINWKIIQAMGLVAHPVDPHALAHAPASLVIDAIFGTGLTRPPREPFGTIVHALKQLRAPVLSVDLPSGLDADSGQPLGIDCITATRTITFVAEKQGFAHPAAAQYLGRVAVADIGEPRELIEQIAGDTTIG